MKFKIGDKVKLSAPPGEGDPYSSYALLYVKSKRKALTVAEVNPDWPFPYLVTGTAFRGCFCEEELILVGDRVPVNVLPYAVGYTLTGNEPCVITDGDSVVCVCPGSKGMETAHKIATLLNKEKSS